MAKNRGKTPSQLTIMKLVATAGGRCQFEGCNCNVFIDEITGAKFNHSNVAHIVASSSDGPRGSRESERLSDNLDNLMLLCPKHHKEIDSDTQKYTVECLREMKRKQEVKVQKMLDGMDFPESEIIVLQSPIKGDVNVHVDKKQTVAALRKQWKNPASTEPILIDLQPYGEYLSKQYWDELSARLEQEVEKKVVRPLQYNPELMLAVFPLAPIPLVAKLGELLGDKRVIDIFQKKRVPDTWCWEHEEVTNSFSTEKTTVAEGNPDKVALIISLTDLIAPTRITSVFDAGTIIHIRALNTGVDCVRSVEDLHLFWKEYQRACDLIKDEKPEGTVALFPAVPVSAAFEIGRRHMPGVHLPLHIYEEDNGFFETLVIGG